MSWRRQFSKLRAVFQSRRVADELAEEIRCHLNMEEQENIASGMSPDEAHYSALRRFGNTTLTQERSHEMWIFRSIDTLLQDIRFGVRQLRRNPSFTIVAVLTLALGIGATTAIFSVINSVLLRPLPFRDPGQLVRLFETEEAPGEYPLSGADYLDWQAQNHAFQASALFGWNHEVSAGGANGPESANVLNTQANLFDVLGVSPLLGRTFTSGEDTAGNNHVAVLSFGFWQRHFGGRKDALGQSFILNNEPYTVVGIMTRSFNMGQQTDVWTPCDITQLGPHGNHQWQAVARLKAGVSLTQARQELKAISVRLEKQYPDSNNGVHAVLLPLKEIIVGNSRTMLLMLLGAVSMVLLLACVNVTNLLLARAGARQREMAIRTSVGAGRWRMVRQLLTESVLLSLTGALLGTLGAWWCVRLIQSVETIPIPRVNPIEIDSTVLLFTIGIGLLVGVLFGLAPAVQISELRLSHSLRGLRTRQLLRDGLVIAEVAFTLALLVGAGLLLRSFSRLRTADIGANPHNVISMAINLPDSKYPTIAKRRQFFDQLLERTQNTHGVESAAISTEIPLIGGNNGYIKVPDNADSRIEKQLVGANYITPGYFRTLGVPVLSGRSFTPEEIDRAASTSERLFTLYKASQENIKMPPDITLVAIISKSMGEILWPNQNPVGKSYLWNEIKVTVVGVVGNVKEYGIRAHPIPQAYYPMPIEFGGDGSGRLTIRTGIPPKAILSAIRAHVHSLDDSLPLFHPETMEQIIADDTEDASLQTYLLGIFAALALVLAAVGLYGVTSYLVTQRTREIGIRMALGAKQSNVLGLIMRQGVNLTIIGIILGALAAFALTRSIASLLYNMSPNDPATFSAVTALLALVALAAFYVPARRASKVDPLRALRHE